MKKTKIICSLGPSCYGMESIHEMIENGMDVARINFSHAKKGDILNEVNIIKKIRREENKNVGILFDTKGPEFRTGKMENGHINLREGNLIKIVKDNVLGTEESFSVNHPDALDKIDTGDTVLIENALMKLRVISKDDDGITCQIINGGILEDKKGINVPGVKLEIPIVSKDDHDDIIFALDNGADFIALSFVSTKQEVLNVRKILNDYGSSALLISKIENKTGLNNLKEIISVSDGVMVARGDLGSEIHMEELPFYQKQIIKECRNQGKIAIVATEMLESMKTNRRPTRAEVSDVTSAVMDGTDAVMLSGETAVGNFPIEAVKCMSDICVMAEKHISYNIDFKHLKKNEKNALSASAVEMSNILNSKLIIASTVSGASARSISNLRSMCPILVTCTTSEVARSLLLNFGVYPKVTSVYNTTDEIVNDAIHQAKHFIKLDEGDHVIVTGAFPKDGPTNFIRIEKI